MTWRAWAAFAALSCLGSASVGIFGDVRDCEIFDDRGFKRRGGGWTRPWDVMQKHETTPFARRMI